MPQISMPLALCRSLLFVPGNRPDRVPKALATAAGLVCIDLEDAVAGGSAKDEARNSALAELTRLNSIGSEAARIVLRINSLKTPEGLQDILALRQFDGILPPIVVPKVASAEELKILDALLTRPESPPVRFLPMIETAVGLEAAAGIAQALSPERFLGLFLGGVDLSVEMGSALDWEALYYARSRIVHAGRTAGLGVIDSVSLDVVDLEGLENETRRAARLGFVCKAAIHPKQIDAIHRGFVPDKAAIHRAQAVVDAYEQGGGGVALLDGKMIERPVYEAAKNLLTCLFQPQH